MSEHEIHRERVRAAYIQGWIDSVSEPRPFARARESMADRYMDQVQTADSYEKSIAASLGLDIEEIDAENERYKARLAAMDAETVYHPFPVAKWFSWDDPIMQKTEAELWEEIWAFWQPNGGAA